MAKHSVLIEVSPAADSRYGAVAGASANAAEIAANISGIAVDPSFGVIDIPATRPSVSAVFNAGDIDEAFDQPTRYVMRGDIEIEDTERIEAENPGVRIYSDPEIEVCPICPGSGPLGNAGTVASLLGRTALQGAGMTGRNVLLAIVDTGLNINYLRSKGVVAPFDGTRSWVPRPGLTPGALPVGHGTMCAYDATIAAPRATLLDVALLLSNRPGGTVMEGLLSDAVLAYRHLVNVMRAPRRPGELRSMVVNNSWGMFHKSWDYPVGHHGNYSHNPNHPFNVIVRTLAVNGADIFFAAGNCGRDCPDGRCQGITNAGITGANSSPYVTTVAGVDVTKTRVGYSTSGPGTLYPRKPDIAAYTHFAGSGVYAADGGTSAACPVAAGVVAAFRSRFHYNPANPVTSPAAVRSLVSRLAEDRGSVGFDFDYGFGIINGRRMAAVSSLAVEEPFQVSSLPRAEIEAYDNEMAANARAYAARPEPAESERAVGVGA
jgi:subtilisin family serine protease